MVTPRYENRTERRGAICRKRERGGIQTREDMWTPEDEKRQRDRKDSERGRRDVRKIDGLTQRTDRDREIIERQDKSI